MPTQNKGLYEQANILYNLLEYPFLKIASENSCSQYCSHWCFYAKLYERTVLCLHFVQQDAFYDIHCIDE